MDTTTGKRTWRDALKDLCETPSQKQALAEKIGFVSVRTIDRWISGHSQPQKQDYLKNLAAQNAEIGQLLQEAFPDAFSQRTAKQPSLPIERVNLPVEFFRRVLHAYAHTAPSARRWTIFHLVSNQMLPHLDSEQAGLMMVSVQQKSAHSTPLDNAPDTLQLEDGSGNGVWATRQTTSATCTEPWLVQAIRSLRPFFLQSLAETSLTLPSCFANHDLIQSVGFFPLYRGGKAAGGILLLSAQPDFFTPLRQTLIEEYSYLLALAFGDSEFQ
jgi:hypothetical protein